MPLLASYAQKVYHKDVGGIPANVPLPRPGLALRYSQHSMERVRGKQLGVSLPARLPSSFEVVEAVVIADDYPLQWTVRCWASSQDDLVLVVRPDGTVKTAWLNAREDTHRTLRVERYAAATR